MCILYIFLQFIKVTIRWSNICLQVHKWLCKNVLITDSWKDVIYLFPHLLRIIYLSYKHMITLLYFILYLVVIINFFLLIVYWHKHIMLRRCYRALLAWQPPFVNVIESALDHSQPRAPVELSHRQHLPLSLKAREALGKKSN